MKDKTTKEGCFAFSMSFHRSKERIDREHFAFAYREGIAFQGRSGAER
jgi:hypothetical protein